MSMMNAAGRCTAQLWDLPPPFGAVWTESMRLGGELHQNAREEYYRELEAKNLDLGGRLNIITLQVRRMHAWQLVPPPCPRLTARL